MSILTRPLTYDDLIQMPDDGNRYEIIAGELIVSAAPSRIHQRFAYVVSRVLGDAVDAEGLGEVYFAPVDVRLTPHDVVQPDLLFIRRDRLHIYRPEGVVEGPPGLVVEIISPSSRAQDEVRKGKLYADAGVPEYWFANPELPDFGLYALRSGSYERMKPEDGLVRSIVIPGLVIDVATLFADLESKEVSPDGDVLFPSLVPPCPVTTR